MKTRILLAALVCLTARDVMDAECKTQCFSSGKDGGVALSDKVCRCFSEVEKLDQENRPIMWNLRRVPAPAKKTAVQVYNYSSTSNKKTVKDLEDEDRY